MSIKIEPLQKAFALANKLADNPDIAMEQRKNYRSLESLIWTAFGEEMEAPRACRRTQDAPDHAESANGEDRPTVRLV